MLRIQGLYENIDFRLGHKWDRAYEIFVIQKTTHRLVDGRADKVREKNIVKQKARFKMVQNTIGISSN